MALSRRSGTRFQASIWPGFVDAMTGLLLVLMFVLSIFMIVQFVLTERITGQESELDQLSVELATLARALGREQQTNAALQDEIGALGATLSDAEAQIAALTAVRDAQNAALDVAQTQISGFEAQVAALIAARDDALATVATLQDSQTALEAAQADLIDERDALNLALATARDEIDAQTEEARLAAARREALDALVADLRAENVEAQSQIETLTGDLTTAQDALSDQEAARVAEAAAAELLRSRLADADAELTAMTLALENQRREAEETLTLLGAARAAEADLDARLAAALLETDRLEEQAAEAAAAQDAVQDLETQQDLLAGQLADVLAELDEAEALVALEAAARAAAEARAAELSQSADDQTLALREQLAAALAAQRAAEILAEDRLSDADQRAVLLSEARSALSQEEEISARAQRQVEVLNQQVAELRAQLGDLQSILDDARDRDAAQQVQLESLGSELNTALARVAAEERRRAELEEADRIRLEEEAARLAEEAARLTEETQDLAQYRSEFFGRLRDVLGNQEGVQIAGDRFVFSSEVLFEPARADLSVEGQAEVAKVAAILASVAGDIPPGIDWIIRVDGHTDNLPLSGAGLYADNWELSQARALSVVRFMVDALGIPPSRLAANGFGEYQPVAEGDSPEARAQNRRIELKFTER
ncbi:MAG: peptidoglycan -binding protein [Pseudomonadota bacterium]